MLHIKSEHVVREREREKMAVQLVGLSNCLPYTHAHTGVVYREDTNEVLVIQDKFKAWDNQPSNMIL